MTTPRLLICIALTTFACGPTALTDPIDDPDDDPDDDPMGALRSLVGSEFRAIDGSNNNVVNPDWGRVDTALLRLARADYADQLSTPAGADRPSARAISNAIVAQPGSLPNSQGASDYLWAWGQFLDHDVDLTEGAEPQEAFDIAVPSGDPSFDPSGTGNRTISMHRSAFVVDDDGVRQQVNQISAYIDASSVYGSDPERAAALRENDGSGRLKVGTGNLLPKNEDGFPNAENGPTPSEEFFFAGDVRANEVISLTALHTLFVREHNRLVDLIGSLIPELDGDDLYELGRRLVGAEIQAITYREFLPRLLGNAVGPYAGYQESVEASIANEFSTAAYRIGHTMLSPTIRRIDANGDEVSNGHVSLQGAFFNPTIIEDGGIDSILRGLASQHCESIDGLLVDDVRNFLFGPPGAGGFDLASLNIQRGRDHGLASYNDARRDYGLGAVSNFSDISSNPAVVAKLTATYASVDEIDLWVGGLAEDSAGGSMVGELFTEILAEQFIRLRSGDRFWYETLPPSLVDLVESLTLAEIIRLNTNVGDELVADVFAAPAGSGGQARLVLNEILADPSPLIDANGDGVVSSTNDEFIEFVNVGNASIDLSGASYADAFGVRFTFPDGVVVAPGQPLVLFGGGEPQGPELAGAVVVTANGSLSLNNGGDTVSLTSASGETLVSSSYDGAPDQSVTRQIELDDSSSLVPHLNVSSNLASPGRRVSGDAF